MPQLVDSALSHSQSGEKTAQMRKKTNVITKTDSTSKPTTIMKRPVRISALSLGLFLGISAMAGAVDQPLPLSQRATQSVIPPLPDIKVGKFRYNDGFNTTSPGDDALQSLPLQEGLTDYNSSEYSSGSNDAVVHVKETRKMIKWKGFDELDRRLLKIALPLTATFAIHPLVQALDLFWVNRLGDALAVAGQAAANQVYGSSFWLFSFLPSVTATLVSKKYASGDIEGTQDAVCNALTVGFFISIVGSILLFFNPEKALSSILKAGAPALKIAKPYLRIRSLSFLPMLTSFVGFSAFRGTLDVKTSVMIAYSCNMLTVLLDPLLIHGLGFGVKGAALATFSAEIVSAITYLVLMRKRDLIRWSKILKLPSFTSLIPLLKGGMALQLRSFALNITFLMVARVIQSMDDTGVAAAANAMATQTFQLGGIVLGALSMVAQTVVPNAMVERYDDEQGKMVGGVNYARTTVNRLMIWGLCIGVGVGALQLLLLPTIMKSSPLQEVRDAARVPALIASWFQGINGLVFVGEGVMMGTGSFMQLGLNTAVGTLGYLASLKIFPQRFGLTGVWIGLVAFTLIRLIGVFIHLFVNGPLTQHNVHKASTTA